MKQSFSQWMVAGFLFACSAAAHAAPLLVTFSSQLGLTSGGDSASLDGATVTISGTFDDTAQYDNSLGVIGVQAATPWTVTISGSGVDGVYNDTSNAVFVADLSPLASTAYLTNTNVSPIEASTVSGILFLNLELVSAATTAIGDFFTGAHVGNALAPVQEFGGLSAFFAGDNSEYGYVGETITVTSQNNGGGNTSVPLPSTLLLFGVVLGAGVRFRARR